MSGWRRRFLPEWLELVLWFLAGIAAQGLWVFPAGSHWPGFALSALATTLLVLAALWIRVQHSRSGSQPPIFTAVERLLRYVWDYPDEPGERRSWAVKESFVLLGKLGTAQEAPSLGVAIITTELALCTFGAEAAASRIDGLVDWAMERSEADPPFWFIETQRDSIDPFKESAKRDIRHTMALGVVLLRAGRDYARTAEHVRLALRTQQDGCWLIPDSTADRAVIATLYGAELLSLAPKNPDLSRAVLHDVAKARARAIEWLMRNRRPNGLWSTGVLGDIEWDGAVATAWVLHRTLPPPRRLADSWRECTETALVQMIRLVERSQTWCDVSSAQRFRIEARVAGAICRARSFRLAKAWSPATHRLAARYTAGWARQARHKLRQPDEDVDLATAVFALWGLADEVQMTRVARSILAERGQ